ncbi:MAG: hypothetical protein E7166_04755 [Firmicutes bacterium]|nr:hypothetical protein [Bacillota bacterium]
MKKIVILLCLLLFTTGCTVSKIDMEDRDNILNITLNRNVNLFNRVSKGYKYYLPKGISLLDYKEYNEILYSNSNKYYLYIDIISYHYKTQKKYTINNNSEYSKILNYNDKNGYLEIKKQDNKYHILYEYNYAKMEAVVKEEDVNETIMNMGYILSSIQYNNIVINSLVGENVLDFKEEKYEIEKPTENDNTFLDYVNTYDKYNGKDKIEDTDTIKNNVSDIDE